MTIWTLISAARRQWPIVLGCVLLTLAGLFWAATRPGVYYQQVQVVFVPPTPPNSPNAYQRLSGSAILTADRIARELGLDPRSPQPVSPHVSIVDQGIRDGSIVRLPNSGGQWANNFEDPVLDVQVAGSDPGTVSRTSAALVKRIQDRMLADQTAVHVPAGLRISTFLSPPSPPIFYARGSTGRALVAVLVLGLLLTALAVVVADRWSRWGPVVTWRSRHARTVTIGEELLTSDPRLAVSR